jgi:hydrogenase-4 component B
MILIQTCILLIVCFLLIGFLKPKFKGFVAIAGVLILSVASSIPAIRALMGQNTFLYLPGTWLSGTIPIGIDALSGWFILIINFTLTTGVIYGAKYMQAYLHKKPDLTIHWIFYLLSHAGMLAVCILRNSIAFLIAWEVMAVSAFFMVIFENNNSHIIKAGINYLIQAHLGVIFITVAFIWVYVAEGSMNFEAIRHFFAHHSNIWLFLIFFIGFGLKAGFIPLHSWLPHAHPAAPSHVSGIMSGVIVKMGIYGILRVITFMQSDFLLLGKIILILSLLTGLYGIINAAVHRDFKRMLAYCTIENIGIIGSGIGLGMIGMGAHNILLMVLGFGSALLHTLNHSLFKSLLFFSVGSVYLQTHTRDMDKLGGLIKTMPKTAVLFLTGALAVGGLPPFSGFVSEFLLYIGFLGSLHDGGMYHVILMIFSIAILSIIGGISVFAFTKTFGVIFLGTPRTRLHNKPVEAPLMMRLPQYFIVMAIIVLALLPVFFLNQAIYVASSAFQGFGATVPVFSHELLGTITKIGLYSLFFFGLIIILLALRKWLTKRLPASISSTWGCGYIAPRPSIQYTGKSFSKTVGKLLNFLVFEQKKYIELERGEVFPAQRKHSSHYVDFFEFRLFDGLINRLLSGMNRFQFIQNGQLQRYILFGLFFIIIIFICSFLNLI